MKFKEMRLRTKINGHESKNSFVSHAPNNSENYTPPIDLDLPDNAANSINTTIKSSFPNLHGSEFVLSFNRGTNKKNQFNQIRNFKKVFLFFCITLIINYYF